MPITRGIHYPRQPYVVPEGAHAWGAKGDWNGKTGEDADVETQFARTTTTEGFDGRIDHAHLRNHEVRLTEEESKFVPNAKNFAPRPKNWKPGKHQNYF